MKTVQIIGIGGGSGSGKTFLAEQLIECIGKQKAALIQQDCYYKDLRKKTPEEISRVNFDHPSALNVELLVKHLSALKKKKEIEKPVYDFVMHSRKENHSLVTPKDIIIVEGIFVLSIEKIRELLDISFFIETSADLRFIRRLRRDLAERGRKVKSVIQQYESYVRPMHLEFVEPSKKNAHIIVSGDNDIEYMALVAKKLTTSFSWNFS